MTTVGNQSPYLRGVQSGSGRQKYRVPTGHLTVTGKAGDVVYIPGTDLVSLSSSYGASVNVQAVGGAVSISTTLAPADLAMSPIQDTSGIWVNATAIAAGPIVALPFVGTAYRISFTADAIVYLVGV